MDDLVEELKILLIDTLDLEEIRPGDIVTDAPLFNEGLGLDSIDALELGVAIQKRCPGAQQGHSRDACPVRLPLRDGAQH